MELLDKMMGKPAVRYGLRFYENIENDNIGLLAAGVAFYFFLAAFPAIGALISLYGLFSDPAFITNQFQNLDNFLPPESLKILADQALSISSTSGTALGLGVIVGLLLTIYSTTKGVKALMTGLNVAYNEKEKRNFVVLNYTSFILTFVMLVYMIFALTMIAIMPAVFSFLHIPQSVSTTLLAARWPLLTVCAIIGLQIVYYYAPSHTTPRWRWFSWGALIAALFWLGASSLFSLFVSNFGNYNETYGSLGAVAVLLLWFWLSALTILIGAEVNASLVTYRREKISLAEASGESS
ncbi:MAG: hypothetical protein DI626_06605 [Micavibrio aeruginosavorus]|uniref:YihY/virulence factor BrkB family protein n=1 Tax=Micavibrio aeruginosavorus TaxID=349221 RepID=A0A2W4ZVP4_9BACT|nr:MAG: hypothetical protein DI626_06605 [Micavibrio aeruginosavorus]